MLAALLRPAPVGRLFGIPVLVVPATFVLVAVLLWPAATDGPEGSLATAVGLLAILAASLVAHELAHALVARRLGLHVLDITIWPLGGMARMEGLAQRPQAEAPVAAAGPLANLALAGLCALLPGTWADFAMVINLVLGVGNLLPAFPLDGGRILRAWLARRSPMVDATGAAVRLSRTLAFLGLLAGLWLRQPLLAIILAVYVWWSSQVEYLQVVLRSGQLPTLSFGEVFRRAFGGAAAGAGSGPWRPGAGPDPGAGSAPGAGPPPPPGAPPPSGAGEAQEGEEEIVEELEEFRGSLDEFFDRRRR